MMDNLSGEHEHGNGSKYDVCDGALGVQSDLAESSWPVAIASKIAARPSLNSRSTRRMIQTPWPQFASTALTPVPEPAAATN
jgi:hypothetical protein